MAAWVGLACGAHRRRPRPWIAWVALTPLLVAAACAQTPLRAVPAVAEAAAEPAGPAGQAARLWMPPVLSAAGADAEAAQLRADFAREVPRAVARNAERDRRWLDQARALLAAGDYMIDRPQLLVVVDRNPRAQQLSIVLARPGGAWEVIGATRVSTGQQGRKDYYITPIGVFPHTDAILDYRAEGTFNENHIRGLGSKGMRVWDFGWQTATKGWRKDGEQGDIRLLMHATDPDYLERRLGRPASQGCVRVAGAVNRFLDRHGVLDADYERAAQDDIRYRALLRPDRTPSPLAGDLMVVVDSAGSS